jgi:hypothetical protein
MPGQGFNPLYDMKNPTLQKLRIPEAKSKFSALRVK